MTVTSTVLDSMQQIGRSLGYLRDIESEPAGFDCTVHDVPLVRHSLDTINGWQSAVVCPADDGTCYYPATVAPTLVDPPEPVKAAPTDSGGF